MDETVENQTIIQQLPAKTNSEIDEMVLDTIIRYTKRLVYIIFKAADLILPTIWYFLMTIVAISVLGHMCSATPVIEDAEKIEWMFNWLVGGMAWMMMRQIGFMRLIEDVFGPDRE